MTVDENISLYPEPVSVPLNTKEGYTINVLTGDSIKPLINSLGDTIQTGVSISLKAAVADTEKITKPNISKIAIQQKEPIITNIHRVPEKLEIISGDTLDFKNSNEIIDTGTPINIIGQIKPLHEPQPVKTLPLRFKDGATSNIQYLEVGQGLSYSFVHSILCHTNYLNRVQDIPILHQAKSSTYCEANGTFASPTLHLQL